MLRGRRERGLIVLAVMLAIAVGSSCTKKQVPVEPGAGMGGPGGTAMAGGPGGPGGMGGDDSRWRELGIYSEPEKQQFLQKAEAFQNEDVYFDFDSFVLMENAKRILASKAEFLSHYPKVSVTVEGHCDKRGTHEYNLALGERRAQSAVQFLVNSGVNQQRLRTVSYGKERPIATGDDEASMAKNRRDHFVLQY